MAHEGVTLVRGLPNFVPTMSWRVPGHQFCDWPGQTIPDDKWPALCFGWGGHVKVTSFVKMASMRPVIRLEASECSRRDDSQVALFVSRHGKCALEVTRFVLSPTTDIESHQLCAGNEGLATSEWSTNLCCNWSGHVKVTNFVLVACSPGTDEPAICKSASRWRRRDSRKVAYFVLRNAKSAFEVARFVAFRLHGEQAVRRRLCDPESRLPARHLTCEPCIDH